MSLLKSLFFFLFCLFFFLFLYYNFAFFNEEFVIFVSLLLFFYILFSILKKSISKYFFLKMEYVYFSFLHLIIVNLLLVKKLSSFISNFVYKSKMNNNSELFFVTFFITHNVFKLHLLSNSLFVKQIILRLFSNMFFQYNDLLLLEKHNYLIHSSLYYFIITLNYSMLLFICKKKKNL